MATPEHDDALTGAGISRRTIVKGAAWSLPVLAVAVATPAHAASVNPLAGVDVQVTGACENDYDLGVLTALVGAGLVGLVQTTILAPLGLTSGASRTFTITAAEGDIPAGTTFALTYPDGLLDLSLLEGIIEAQALTVATINTTTTTFTLDAPITEGNSISFDIFSGLLDIGLASSVTLSLVGTDDPSVPPGQPDSASVDTTLGVGVDLSTLVPGATLAVQVC